MAAKNWLRNLPHDEFAERAAYYFGEINTLHPFREGNGRALREYIRYIAGRAGHKLTWEGLDRDEMTRASILAHNSTHHALRDILIKQMSCCR
jgi:cell filamentation protein